MFFVETLQRRKRENRQGKLLPIGHRAGAKARVLKDPRGETPEPGFPTVDGPHYYDVLAALHDFVTPEWYFEIGTNRGGSLEVCPGKFIAVDPQLILTNFSMKDRPEGHFFQITSDGFFDLGFLEGLGIRPELGFLDGMHRFEFLLRDFMNFEKRSAPGAIAILHDCLPFTAAMTARDWDPKKTRQWTGDVWKTLAILLKHRPDLQIDVLDAYPTGLVILRNLDAENTTLAGCYDAVVAEFLDTDIAAFGPATYFDMFQIQSSHAAIAALRATGGPAAAAA